MKYDHLSSRRLFLKLLQLTLSMMVPWMALALSKIALKMFPLNWKPMLSKISFISPFVRTTVKSSSFTPNPANSLGNNSSIAVVSSA